MRDLVRRRLAVSGVAVSITASEPTDPDLGEAAVDVVLLCLADDFWLDDVRAAHAELPEAALVVIRPDDAPSDAGRAVRAGAVGIVRESTLVPDLPLVIWAVLSGMVCIPGDLRDSLETEHLSARERQILSMVAGGHTNQAVAAALHVTVSTVKSHLSSAYAKLGVRTRREASALFREDQTVLPSELSAPSRDGRGSRASLGSF
jgi:DNA-binding NarL/FixJ family response regulator